MATPQTAKESDCSLTELQWLSQLQRNNKTSYEYVFALKRNNVSKHEHLCW